MPGKRVERMDEGKRERLLVAAIAEFGAHGYELASINRILSTAKLSKSSFYYFFHDKADLAAAAFLHAAEPSQSLVTLGTPKTPKQFWEALRRVSFENLDSLKGRRAEYECVTRLSTLLTKDPGFAAKVLPLFEPRRREMVAFLERGVALGALRDDLPLPMLMALMEAVKTTVWKLGFPEGRVPPQAEFERYAEVVLELAQRLTAPAKKKRGSSR